MASVHSNGVRLHVTRPVPPRHLRGAEAADRPVVVFLHGLILADSSSCYFTLAAPMSDRADTIVYDLRGHGRSDSPISGYSLQSGVDDLTGLLDQCEVDRPVHLVANSFGGAIALTAAVRRPERVASMTLLEAHCPRPGWGPTMAASLALSSQHLDPETAMAELGLRSRRKAVRVVERADQLINHTSLLPDLRDEPGLTDDELAGITCPVLCCYGSESDLAETGRWLASHLPRARYDLFLGATHSLIAERSAELRTVVAEWIDAPDGFEIDLRDDHEAEPVATHGPEAVAPA